MFGVPRPKRAGEVESVAPDHLHPGKARGNAGGEIGIIFHRGQPLGRDAAFQQRLGDHAGARAQFQHRTGTCRINLVGNGAGQRPAGGRHRADMFGTGDQGAQEAQIVRKRIVAEGLWCA